MELRDLCPRSENWSRPRRRKGPRSERFEQQHDDLIIAPERHDSFDEWIAWGRLEGQLMAMNWAMGWKWKGEESWKEFDSFELVDAWRAGDVAPNGVDGEREWLAKWTEGPKDDEIRMGTIEIGGQPVYFVHGHNQSDEVKELVDHALDGGWPPDSAQQSAVDISRRADHEACFEILEELLRDPQLTAEKWEAIEAHSEERPLE